MKIYRISYRGTGVTEGEHQGYDYVSSKRAVARIKRKSANNDDDYYFDVTQINVEISKRGILAALNDYAGHPDNG